MMNIPSLQDQYKQSHGDYRKELQLIYEHEARASKFFHKILLQLAAYSVIFSASFSGCHVGIYLE